MMATYLLWLPLVAGFQCLLAAVLKSSQSDCDPSQPSLADAEEFTPAHTSLLQTSLRMGQVKAKQPERLDLLSNNDTLHRRTTSREMLHEKMYSFDKDECFPTWSLETQLMFSVIREMERLPAGKMCHAAVWPFMLSQTNDTTRQESDNAWDTTLVKVPDWELNATWVQDSAHKIINQYTEPKPAYRSSTAWVLIAYTSVVFVSTICIMQGIYSSPASVKLEAGSRPEAEAWNQGLVSWFRISWATPWMQRWANEANDKVKIRASQIGQIGDPDDECKNAAKRFSKVWDEQSKGPSEGALLRSIYHFLGPRKLMGVVLAGLACDVLLYIGPVITVWWTLNTAKHFHQLRSVGYEVSMEDYLPTVICIISMFTLMPFIMTCFSTFVFLVCSRLNLRMQGALATAIYQKGMRLPAGLKTLRLKDDAKQDDGNAGSDTPQDYSIVSLVSTDVNLQLATAVWSFLSLMTTLPTLLVLLIILAIKIKAAVFIALFTCVLVMGCFIIFSTYMATGLGYCQYFGGSRTALFQEFMFGIRIVKSYAWEETAKERISELRGQEMIHLLTYWKWLGAVISTVLAMPKTIVVASLFGYIWFYESMAPSEIFVIIQVLNALNGATTVISTVLPIVAACTPAIKRIEMFLKIEESEIPGKKEQRFMPDWAETWGNDFTPGMGLPELQMQGSFSWLKGENAVLHDIEFCMAKGEKIAVIGEIGSGKTTFLQALSGELYPVGAARLRIPNKIAIHSQVPYIMEGTLKENVLFYQPYDDNLYSKAIHAACLLKDLEILPGGDRVPIGSRGISLSGGQKARVSVARTAYCQNAEAVLLDDPLASLDSHTGNHIIQHLFKGSILEGRAVVCVCQPHVEILEHFDRVLIMRDGRIEAQGQPSEVVKSLAFKRLMSQNGVDIDNLTLENPSVSPLKRQVSGPDASKSGPQVFNIREEPGQFREEESEGRFDYATLKHFILMGGWKRLFFCFLFYIFMIMCMLLSEITLGEWSNEVIYRDEIALVDPDNAKSYTFKPAWRFLCTAFFWVVVGILWFVWSWYASTKFTMTISDVLHKQMLGNLMRAPVDRFYDKTPVGRILNRMSTDLANMDQRLFCGMTTTTSTFSWIFIFVLFVHWKMPISFSLVSLPIWFAICIIFLKYLNVVVPLRYLNNVSRSEVNVYFSEVDSSKTTLRSFQVQEQLLAEQCGAMDNFLKSQFAGDCVKRWTVNRLILLWSAYATLIAVFGMLHLHVITVGTMSVCITGTLLILMKLDTTLDALTGLQFEFVCLNRLHEYLNLPQERSRELLSDAKLTNWSTSFLRSNLNIAGKFEVREGEHGIQVWCARGQREQLVLDQVPGHEALRIPNEAALEFLREVPNMKCMQMKHRITAVNDAYKNAKELALEISDGTSDQILLRMESAWLMGGARIQLIDLVAGYADSPSNVLKGINITIEAKAKAAVVGTTGCGKSTLILTLLRMLEPRAGRILINDIDTQDIGLKALRTNLGLVPQDPFVFSGSIRKNLDPFDEFTDSRIWKALQAVQMAEFIESLGNKLDHMCVTDGGNLSFGQRQLLCIARMVVRQPALLLLDECTSAIDPRTQELVQEAIWNCFPESTLVVVAHRLETIVDFDTIIVLEKGRVVEKGSVKALASQRGGIFAGMLAARVSK